MAKNNITQTDLALIANLSAAAKSLVYYAMHSLVNDVERIRFARDINGQYSVNMDTLYSNVRIAANAITQSLNNSPFEAPSNLSIVTHFTEKK